MLLAADPEIIRDMVEVTKHCTWQSHISKLEKLHYLLQYLNVLLQKHLALL